MESPRRNFRGELLTALAAVSMLALAIVFAVILTADTLPGVSPAPSPTVDSMAPTQAPSDMPSDTPLAPPPSSTPKPAATTAVATAEETTGTARSNSEPSATAEATASPRASATPRPSTTPSPTQTATSTSTRTPTRTPTPSPTSTWTPSATPTETPIPTDTRVYTPTMTSPPAQSSTPRPALTPQSTVPATCAPPPGWQPYAIQSGDNLFRLALRAGLSTAELQQVNCIANAASITTGQVIYVPPAFFADETALPASTSTGTTGGSTTGSSLYPLSLGCLLTQIRFSAPAPGSTLSGRVTVRGTATLSDLPNFEYYKVELRGTDGVYRNLAQSANPAPGPDSVLALFDSTGFARGEYQLVLTVVDGTGNFPEPCAIRVYIQN